jgi:hypothetical protein
LKGTEIQGQAEKELFNVLSADESKKLHELLAKLQQ